jgi:hypothetical protein
MPQFPKEKIMKRILMIVALACVLSTSAVAGEIPTGGFAPPPPPEGVTETSTTLPGDVPTTGDSTIGDETIVSVMGTLCALIL